MYGFLFFVADTPFFRKGKYMDATVAVQHCGVYDFETVYAAVQQLFVLAPPPDVRGKTVLVKPNILSPKKPETAVCTHPAVVGAVVKAFVAAGAAAVLVGDSPAVVPSRSAAKVAGIYEQVIQNGGKWVDFDVPVPVTEAGTSLVHRFELAEPVVRADIVVSVAKLKSHQLMSYTGAMKNMFGAVVGLEKSRTHYRFPVKKDFAAYITDLNIAVHPAYAVMDAVIGMDGPGGPGSGNPVKIGFLASSVNILALDWICAAAAGYNPAEIMNLRDALERRLWLDNPAQIRITGGTADSIRCPAFKAVHEKNAAEHLGKMLPPFIHALAGIVFTRTPHFDRKKCIRCGKCVEICPPKALSFRTVSSGTSRVVLNRSDCQHCFCCHEVCPVAAITLRHF